MKNLIIVLIGILFSSCSYQLWFKPKYFNSLYDGKYTGIDSLIEVVGYYKSEIIVPKVDTALVMKKYLDSSKPYVDLYLFYSDGTIIETNSRPDDKSCENDVDKDKIQNIKHKHLKFQWGTYRLINDTIKAQFIRDDGPMSSPVVFEKKILIISDTILKVVFEKLMNPEYSPNKMNGDGLLYFHSYTNRIDSTSNPYLKKKWFWEKEAHKNRKNK